MPASYCCTSRNVNLCIWCINKPSFWLVYAHKDLSCMPEVLQLITFHVAQHVCMYKLVKVPMGCCILPLTALWLFLSMPQARTLCWHWCSWQFGGYTTATFDQKNGLLWSTAECTLWQSSWMRIASFASHCVVQTASATVVYGPYATLSTLPPLWQWQQRCMWHCRRASIWSWHCLAFGWC